MLTKYFITQPPDVSGVLPTSAMGLYCKPTVIDVSCVDYDIIYVSIRTSRYAIAKNSDNNWVLLDVNNECELIASTDQSGNAITQYDWVLTADGGNLGKIVINTLKNNKKRLIGRFRPLCVRCPLEGSPCNDFSYYDLAERRKFEILQYKKNAVMSDLKTTESKTSKIKYAKTINSQRNRIIDINRNNEKCSQNEFCSDNRFGKCSFVLCLNPKVPYTKK